jgi:hypothetical protein
MKKHFIILVVTVLCFIEFNSQTNSDSNPVEKSYKDRTFHSLGTSVYLDLVYGPIKESIRRESITDPFGNTVTNTVLNYTRVIGSNYFSLIYRYRYNLYELGNEASYGINLLPSLGLFAGGSTSISYPNSAYDFGTIQPGFSTSLNFPIIVGLNLGAAATNTSTSTMGFFIGGGYEYNMAPMFYQRDVLNKDIVTNWFNPCLSISALYEGNTAFGNLQEVNLKIGFGLVGQDVRVPSDVNNGAFGFVSPVTIRLSYFTYLNY